MKKVRIFIENEMETFDDKVFVDCLLPIIPRVNDLIWIDEACLSVLNRKAKKTNYITKYYTDYATNGTINFECCNTVKLVGYETNKSIIKVVIGL